MYLSISRNSVVGAFGGYYGSGVKMHFRGTSRYEGGRVVMWEKICIIRGGCKGGSSMNSGSFCWVCFKIENISNLVL